MIRYGIFTCTQKPTR